MSKRPHSRDRRPHLASLVEDFRGYGSQIAVVSRAGLRRQALTYAGLAELAGRFAAVLEARGIHKGERVVIWGENGGAWLAAFWGCVLRGVVVVPMDVSGSTAFAERVIHEVWAKLIVGDGEKLRQLTTQVPAIALEDFAERLPKEPLLAVVDGLAESDLLQIVFTSGTTGDPKGVVHTHHNILASFSPIEREIGKYLKYEGPFHPLRFLVTPPLSHVFGQFMGIWIPILLAAEVHFESRFVAGDLMATIHRERISVLAAVPRVLEILRSDFELRFPELGERSKHLEKRGASEKPRSPIVSALRRWWVFRDVHREMGWKFWAVVSGGATLNESLEGFWSSLGFVVVQGYGMTETAALVSLTHPFHPARAGGSVGKVLPGREVRLGADGEVSVRGEIVSQATWEGGELRPRESPWLATGDLASIDESGDMRFRGRKKDVIVSASGLNIYPDDLEAALLRQAQVQAVAVIEVEGPKGGEPMAALVMRGAGDAAEAVRAANAELAEFQQIRRWVIWPEPDLPRGPTGKILHRMVAAAIRSSAREHTVTPASAGTLAGLIAKITGEDAAAAADSARLHGGDAARLSEDLHLDSLGRVELQSSIETRFGIALDDAEYQGIKTLGELKQMVQRPTEAWSGEEPGAVEGASHARREEHIYPEWPWSWHARAVRFAFQEAIMRPLVWLLANPRVVSEPITNVDKPLLIVANHVTTFDVPLILYALRHLRGRVRGRVAVAMAAGMLLDWRKGRNQGNAFFNFVAPFQYWLVTALFNVFPLPRTGNFRSSFAHAGRAMDRGYHVLVFPEGERTPDGKMHAFLGGSGLLWKELRAEALPVYLGGVGELKVNRSNWFRSGKIWVRAGKAMEPPETGDPAEMTKRLEEAVRGLGERGGEESR